MVDPCFKLKDEEAVEDESDAKRKPTVVRTASVMCDDRCTAMFAGEKGRWKDENMEERKREQNTRQSDDDTPLPPRCYTPQSFVECRSQIKWLSHAMSALMPKPTVDALDGL